MNRIDCFVPFVSDEQVAVTAANLRAESEVAKVEFLDAAIFKSTTGIRKIAESAAAPFTMIYTKTTELSFGQFALERFLSIAEDSSAAMVYADHFNEVDGNRAFAPVIDCQEGALRDDFDFGSVLIYRTSALKEAVARMDVDYYFSLIFFLISFASLNRLLAMLSLIAAICIISL